LALGQNLNSFLEWIKAIPTPRLNTYGDQRCMQKIS